MSHSLAALEFIGSTSLPTQVRIVEVGPRDGLQNEANLISLDDKLHLIADLETAGLRHIEAGSFVNPSRVPQMADTDTLFRRLPRPSAVTFSALTPNLTGYQRAVAAGAGEVAVFAAASETFSRRNINCSIAESLERFRPLLARATEDGIAVRGYVSCIAGCPYEGQVPVQRVTDVTEALSAAGCYEVSLCDTTGVATPAQMLAVIRACSARVPVQQLAVHCHDTYGQALANVYAALQCGVSVVDSAVAGLGGCPYAPGSSGNLASEDLVYLLEGLGIDTGIDLKRLIEAGNRISQRLGRPNLSKAARAIDLK